MWRSVLQVAVLIYAAVLFSPTTGNASQGGATRLTSVTAPTLINPANGAVLASIGPVALAWALPTGATQYHLQVIPFKNDGPGVNLIRDAGSTVVIGAPVLGEGPYVLLPAMTYTWRVRATDATTGLSEADAAWGPWSDGMTFTTPAPSPKTLVLLEPLTGATVASATPTLTWTDANAAVFYYEVQLSEDSSFNTDPATAVRSVYWNLVHGGVSRPLNSWTLPGSIPLQQGTKYYWRVRPRVQGDGAPVEWSTPSWFAAGTTSSVAPVTPTPPAAAADPLGADLTVVDVQFDVTNIKAGSALQLTYRVKNAGLGESKATDLHGVLSSDQTIDMTDTDLGVIGAIPGLTGGTGMPALGGLVTIPATTAPGSYFLGVYVDWSKNNASDPVPANNGFGRTINVLSPCPDGQSLVNGNCVTATPAAGTPVSGTPIAGQTITPTPCPFGQAPLMTGSCGIASPTVTPTPGNCPSGQTWVPPDGEGGGGVCTIIPPTPTASATPEATSTPSATPFGGAATSTPTGIPTATPTITATATVTPTTVSATTTPTATATTGAPTNTATPTQTLTPTATRTVTPTPT